MSYKYRMKNDKNMKINFARSEKKIYVYPPPILLPSYRALRTRQQFSLIRRNFLKYAN